MLGARADSGGFGCYLAALEAWHVAIGRDMIFVVDNGSCHTSKVRRRALVARADWLEVVSLARYGPELNPKERECRIHKRDHRSHLAPTRYRGLDRGAGKQPTPPGARRCNHRAYRCDLSDLEETVHRSAIIATPFQRYRGATRARALSPSWTLNRLVRVGRRYYRRRIHVRVPCEVHTDHHTSI